MEGRKVPSLVIRASALDGWAEWLSPPEDSPFGPPKSPLRGITEREEPQSENMEYGTDFHNTFLGLQMVGLPARWPDILPGDIGLWALKAPTPFSPTKKVEQTRVEAVEERYFSRLTMDDGREVVLTGKFDMLIGSTVIDFKVSASTPEIERYHKSLQWKAYLMMTGCQFFAYIAIHRGKLRRDGTIHVPRTRETVFTRYEGMAEDVRQGAQAAYLWLRENDLLSKATNHYRRSMQDED